MKFCENPWNGHSDMLHYYGKLINLIHWTRISSHAMMVPSHIWNTSRIQTYGWKRRCPADLIAPGKRRTPADSPDERYTGGQPDSSGVIWGDWLYVLAVRQKFTANVVVGLLGNKSPDSNRPIPVFQSLRMVYDYRLHLVIRTPRACPWEQSVFRGFEEFCL